MLLETARVLIHGLLFAVLIAVVPGRAGAQEGRGPTRLALVIGEAAYPQGQLPTATADAGLMASSFMQAGFDVTAVADADAALLRKSVATFAAKVRAAGPQAVVALYVAGDGLQYAGENWLVPVGARIDRDDDVPGAALRLTELSGPLEALPATTRLFLFDLARETPFARQGSRLAGGLALTDAPVGSIYAYNTAPGAMAPPDVPPFGAYARSFAEAMQGPGLTIGEVLRRTRLRMGERTDGAAVPFDDGSADPAFAFYPGPPPAGPTSSAAIAGLSPPEAYSTAVARDTLPSYATFVATFSRDALVGRVRAMAAVRREALFWSEAARANTPRAYWTYLRRYPRGPHFGDVRRLLYALHAALEPPPRFEIVAFEGLPPPPPEELATLAHPFLAFGDADGPSIPPPPAAMLPPARSAFFDLAAPPPLAPPGGLPLPLPVPTPDGQGHAPGRIEQPAVAGGALVTTLTGGIEGFAMTTAKGDGTVVSRVTEATGRDVRTIRQLSASGAMISRVTISRGADGAATIAQTGPGDRLIGRSLQQNGAAGTRVITLFDPGSQPVSTTIVSAAGIVTASALFPGRMPPSRFVVTAALDAKGEPLIALEGEVGSPTPTPTPASRAKEEAKIGAAVASVEPPTTGKAPALPAAAGLTGQAPALDLPPPPPTPAFDAAAAPVAPTPTAIPDVPAVPAVKPPAVPAPLPPVSVSPPPPPSAAAALPLVVAKPTLDPATKPNLDSAAKPLQAAPEALLPKTPPLPPPRAHVAETRGKRRTGR